jgi:beta-N-acetylhexosaminidase
MLPPDAQRIAGRLLCVGFDGLEPTDELRGLIGTGVRSVILFGRNVADRAQVGRLCRAIKAIAAPEPVLICIDHEGGELQHLSADFEALPAAREVGASGPERAAEIGAGMAATLRRIGIDLNLAPVLDVDTNPDNPVIGPRAFGRDPSLVGACGAALIVAMQAGGVAAFGKHCPGHRDTHLDIHHDLPVLAHDLDRIRRIELPPFRAAIDAGVASIMTAHVVFTALDRERPATLSPAVIGGLMRREVGFDGVVISDDLEMKAIADRWDLGPAAVEAVTAGIDLVLCCHTPDRQRRVLDALTQAIAGGRIGRGRAEEARRRLDALFGRYVRPA